ncbi:C40 family peptidase [bacterium]|nr:C40 family peptidase [bacterium]
MGVTEHAAVSNIPSAKLWKVVVLFLFWMFSSLSFAERLVINLTLPQANEEKANYQKIWVVSVIKEGAGVYSAPSTRSTLYYRCPKDMYLAVKEERGDWLGIIMIDGSLGWIEKKNTKSIPNVSNIILYVTTNFNPSTTTNRSLSFQEKIVQTALGFLGVPYRWGGVTSRGMDCSGFVQKVFSMNGIRLPRSAEQQAKVGISVPLDKLEIGDRLYFIGNHGRIDHTGIYLGNGLFIHSARSKGGVSIDSIYDEKWRRILAGARRL